MRRHTVAASIVLIIGMSSAAQGQPPLERRLIFDVNGGLQAQSSSRTDIATFELNREVGTLRGSQTLGSYGVLDGGGSLRLWKRLGVGFAVSRARGTDAAIVEADVPHPFFFEFDRQATTTVAGLAHRELAYHLSAQAQLPMGSSTLLRIVGGPTYFDASQQLVSGVQTAERGDPFDEVDIVSTSRQRVSVTTWGYHVGADVTYFGLRSLGLLGGFGWLEQVGLGVKVRYHWAKPDIELQGVKQERALQVGLVHIVGGLRLGF